MENKNTRKGDQFLCIKSVYMKPEGRKAYEQGKIYIAEQDGCITDIQGRKDHWWSSKDALDKYFVPVEGTELFDTYGVRLQVGQTVAVVVTESIVLKGEITEIDTSKNQVRARVTWPAGNTSPIVLASYSRQDGQIHMNQVLILGTEEE